MTDQEGPTLGGVRYVQAEQGYFEQRTLRRYAGIWSLWALGVGAVISGDFFGWNFGLTAGGFGGLLVATGIIALMYVCICYSIAEMSPALPHSGGAYSFGRTAMGPWGGFVTGLAENMEYVLTPAVIVVGIGGYLGAICEALVGVTLPQPIWWLLSYGVFVGLNVWGVEISFKFTVVITVLALLILMVFWTGAATHFSWSLAFNIAPQPGESSFLPKGLKGVVNALPFAMWFYLAIEQLPLAAEEAHDPKRDMPRGLLLGIVTLIVASVLTLILNAGIPPGAAMVGTSNEPLFLAFETIFGAGLSASLCSLIAVAGLVASFHAIIYAYGRNIYSLSRAGYFPHWLSLTHATRKTPHVALCVGAVIGYVVALLIHYGGSWFGEVPVGATLLNMAAFGAVIAYIMQMVSFVILRRRFHGLERPYISPLGSAGAIFAGVLSAAILVMLLVNPDYSIGIYGCALWFLAGLVYFALHGRKHLVYSPEEAFAEQHRRG